MATGRNGRAQLGATAFARSDPVTKVATVRQSELPLAPYTAQVTGEGIVFTLKKVYEFVFTNSTLPRKQVAEFADCYFPLRKVFGQK